MPSLSVTINILGRLLLGKKEKKLDLMYKERF